MKVYVVFHYNKLRKYLIECVEPTEAKAKKTIERLKKLDKKYPSTIEGYFYEEWEVGKMAYRIQNFLDRKKK